MAGDARIESYFRTLKTELVLHCDYKVHDQARAKPCHHMEASCHRASFDLALLGSGGLQSDASRPITVATEGAADHGGQLRKVQGDAKMRRSRSLEVGILRKGAGGSVR